jgi:uncharacterized protein (TIGR03790 family)
MKRAVTSLLGALVLLALLPQWTHALSAGELLLIVNKNEPGSLDLARFYAQARSVPLDQILEFDLPRSEDISAPDYERLLAAPLREAMAARGLKDRIKCLVTLWGVPLRISGRANNPAEHEELGKLQLLHQRLMSDMRAIISGFENQLRAKAIAVPPATDEPGIDGVVHRVEQLAAVFGQKLSGETDPGAQRALMELIGKTQTQLAATVDANQPIADPIPLTPTEQLHAIQLRSDARLALRERARKSGGIVAYARVVQRQIEMLTIEDTSAALDSELSLLHAGDYPRWRWQLNSMNVHLRDLPTPRPIMVMRLDAPTQQLVRDLVANSVLTEREGLKGRIVIDARGIPATKPQGGPDAFGQFDQRLRALADMLKSNPKIEVQMDDNPNLIPPGSATDVALYCGWYSPRQFVPGIKFNRGAVGFHVASFELVRLHAEQEGGWVFGLMHNGVIGTMGPVAEPYLHSFPYPEDFFPLLLTGKLTLAEVYWSTTPLTSWMQAFIGDPLYTPYAKNPVISPEELPAVLRLAIR